MTFDHTSRAFFKMTDDREVLVFRRAGVLRSGVPPRVWELKENKDCSLYVNRSMETLFFNDSDSE